MYFVALLPIVAFDFLEFVLGKELASSAASSMEYSRSINAHMARTQIVCSPMRLKFNTRSSSWQSGPT